MPKRLTVQEVADSEGMTLDELLKHCGNDSVVPACCEDSCEVEPDGRCEHGHPSVLIALGVI